MSIADKITQLTTIRGDIRTALAGKGVTATDHDYADFASDITSIGAVVLPAEYQQVDYLESSGTQRIETGIYNDTLNVPIAYKGKFSFSNTSTRQLYGSQGAFYVGAVNGNIQLGQGGTNNTGIALSNDTWCEFEVYFSGTSYQAYSRVGVFYIDDAFAPKTFATGASDNFTVSSTYQVCVFSMNGQNLPTTSKCAYFTVYQNNVLVRNLIPCYRKADNVIGMYDTVNNQFYTNAGTGSFTCYPAPTT